MELSAAESPKPRYLCCKADESEPGTFKDRMIMEKSPHLLVEGVILSAMRPGCTTPLSMCAANWRWPARRSARAVQEAYAAGYSATNILGSGYDLEVTVHRGAGAYICGEESALMESLEGRRGYPRLKPPFPAAVGLYGGPPSSTMRDDRNGPGHRASTVRKVRRLSAPRRARARASTA